MQTKYVDIAAQEMDEGQTKAWDKYSQFRGMKQQLIEAQHVIYQFYEESRELKRKLAEGGSEEQMPQKNTDPMQEMLKGKEFMHKPETIVLSKPTSPLTRSLARKKSS